MHSTTPSIYHTSVYTGYYLHISCNTPNDIICINIYRKKKNINLFVTLMLDGAEMYSSASIYNYNVVLCLLKWGHERARAFWDVRACEAIRLISWFFG